MSTFSSLMPTKPTSKLALAAALLDRAGVDPDAIRSGVTVIVGGTHVDEDVAEAINALVWDDEAVRAIWGDRAPAAVLTGHVDDCMFEAILARDIPVVLIARADKLPADADVHQDRRYSIDGDLTDDVVRQVIRLVTGCEVSSKAVHGIAASITVGLLKATVRPSATPGDAVARLRSIADRRAAGASASALVDLSRVDDVPLGPQADEKPAKPEVKLSDLSGYGVARDWGMQLAAEMRAYIAGTLAWEDMDRGVLLHGAPGTGKTYLARALAAECGVPLVLSSYADWEAAQSGSAYVIKSMRKIFDDARKKAPCIVFIDEIDSLGVRGGSGHNIGYWDAIINALLAELDGANPREGIVVVAATNNPSNVDPALLRAGRLERQVEIPMPDADAILGILRHHGVPEDGDLAQAARACRGRSPATIAMLCREARRIARTLKRDVCALDVIDAVALTRPERDDAFDRVVCIHEAGHAVADVVLETGLQWVDADACATAAMKPVSVTREVVQRQMVALLAARRADALLGAGVSSGAANDLAKATGIARMAVANWGLGSSIRVHSEDEWSRSRAIRAEVDELLDVADLAAAKLVDVNRDAILAVAEALRERRYLDGAEVLAVMEGCRKIGAVF